MSKKQQYIALNPAECTYITLEADSIEEVQTQLDCTLERADQYIAHRAPDFQVFAVADVAVIYNGFSWRES